MKNRQYSLLQTYFNGYCTGSYHHDLPTRKYDASHSVIGQTREIRNIWTFLRLLNRYSISLLDSKWLVLLVTESPSSCSHFCLLFHTFHFLLFVCMHLDSTTKSVISCFHEEVARLFTIHGHKCLILCVSLGKVDGTTHRFFRTTSTLSFTPGTRPAKRKNKDVA